MAATLDPESGSCKNRQAKFEELIDRFERKGDSIRQHMATLMISFLAGLFVGVGIGKRSRTISISSGGSACPKATRGEFTVIATRGFEIVQDGPTLVLALDAHLRIPSHLLPTICCRIAQPENHPAKLKR